MAERNYLQIAKDAFSASTSYVDSNYRKKWEDGLRMFQSKHPQGSKYNTDAFKYRSKLFRPKSRSMVRKHEAAAAAAFFSNIDVISTNAANENNRDQAASAGLMKEIINYRLTKSIPWFLTVVGAMQDAMTVGVCCSYQYWMYEAEEEISYEPLVDELGLPMLDESGTPQAREVKTKKVLVDKPCVDLQPIENIRIDPGASWVDPIGSSPYVIRMIPMYVTDVKEKMNKADEKTGAPKWKKLTDGEIRAAARSDNDSTAQVREGNRENSKDAGNAPMTDFEIVWVHENFVRVDGKDVVYYTLGTEHMLTDPKPLKDVYFHGERPIVMGFCVVETHKIMPDSPVMLGANLQILANEIQNSRTDNVQLVLNKRYIVKRGAQVDTTSLLRNVAGSVTLANDPTGDIHAMSFDDVTSSSYQEQDRLNVDYDELTGNFSQGSVMTNRKLGETVGGMGMISNAANQITEYTIRTFTETWVEPVLRQLTKLEQKYETDEVILALAGDKAKLLDQYGISQITDELLNQELTLTVNVGMGATDPTQRMGRFIAATKAYSEVAQLQAPGLDLKEIGKEVWGLAGYRDGARFMVEEEGDPAEAKIRAVVQQAQQLVQEAMQDVAQQREAIDQEAAKVAQQKAEIARQADAVNADLQLLSEREQSASESITLKRSLAVKDIEIAAMQASEQAQVDQVQEAADLVGMIEQTRTQLSDAINVQAQSQSETLQQMLGSLVQMIEGSRVTQIRPVRDKDGRLVRKIEVRADGTENPVEIQ